MENKKPFIGTKYMKLYNDGVYIYMITPLFSNTSIFYITTDEQDKILKDIPKDRAEDEDETLGYLVEKSFPKDMRAKL